MKRLVIFKTFYYLIFFALLWLSSASMAQDETRNNKRGFDWSLDVIGTTFLGSNSWFGESEGFIGANTDNWTEGAIEMGIGGHRLIAR